MPKKSFWTAAVLVLLVLGSAACAVDKKKPAPGTSGNAVPSASSSSSSTSSTSASSTSTVLEVVAADAGPDNFVFDTAGVETIAAGPVTFSFTNSATARHEARLVRVLDGNVNAYTAAVQSGGEAAAAPLGQEVAVAGPLDPGASATQTVTLPAGVYVIVCFEKLGDGSTFAAHGMIRPLNVVPE